MFPESYSRNPVDSNNFNLLRFILATLVIFSHCYVIYYGRLADLEPGMILTQNQTDIGGIAVDCFFMISGFLILQSYLNSRTGMNYLRKRFLRIFPGYITAFICSIVVFGMLGSLEFNYSNDVGNYFHTINLKRVIVNAVTLQKPLGGQCFRSLPLPSMLNESLWTIQYEFICYLLIPVFFIRKQLVNKQKVMIIFCLLYLIVIMQHFYPGILQEHLFPTKLLYLVDPVLIPRLAIYFLSGCCFYMYRDQIKYNAVFALSALTITLISCIWLKIFDLVFPISGAYLLFYFAFSTKFRFYGFAKNTDISYGLYLYAWPVQQLISYVLYRHINPLRLFTLAVPVTFIFAWLSWNYVEKVFLKFKRQNLLSGKVHSNAKYEEHLA